MWHINYVHSAAVFAMIHKKQYCITEEYIISENDGGMKLWQRSILWKMM